jgi:hypothetical protein
MIKGGHRGAFSQFKAGVVGLASLEPAASSSSGIEGSALCRPAFPQVTAERQGRRDAFLATSIRSDTGKPGRPMRFIRRPCGGLKLVDGPHRRLHRDLRLRYAPGGGHVGSEPLRRQLSAASPSEPVGRPAVAAGPGSGCRTRCPHGVAVRLRLCCHEGWDPGPDVWRRIRRLLLRRGEQAPAVSGTKSSSCLCGGSRQPVRPFAPVRRRVETRAPSLGRQMFRPPGGLPRVPAALRVLTARPGWSNQTTIEKKPAGRSHA